MFKTVSDFKQVLVPIVLAMALGFCLVVGQIDTAETILVAFIAVMTDNAVTK